MTREQKAAKAKPDFRARKPNQLARSADVSKANGITDGILCFLCMEVKHSDELQMGHVHAYRCEGDCGDVNCDGGDNHSTNVLPMCETCNGTILNRHVKNTVTAEKWAIIEKVLAMPLPKVGGRTDAKEKKAANEAARMTNQPIVANFKI